MGIKRLIEYREWLRAFMTQYGLFGGIAASLTLGSPIILGSILNVILLVRLGEILLIIGLMAMLWVMGTKPRGSDNG